MRNEDNRLVACLVENMLSLALDDVTCGDVMWQYNRNAVETFDLLSVDQRERARRIYRYLISRCTHYAGGAKFNPSDHVNVWLIDKEEAMSLEVYDDDWF